MPRGVHCQVFIQSPDFASLRSTASCPEDAACSDNWAFLISPGGFPVFFPPRSSGSSLLRVVMGWLLFSSKVLSPDVFVGSIYKGRLSLSR